jgi:pimeloyl-ACP methyl ester carboxylesterase
MRIPQERHFRIAGPGDGPELFLRWLWPSQPRAEAPAVLYVHGATFPSALSIAHPFDGISWGSELCRAGFHVWGLDFCGFGQSARFPAMTEPADAHPALGRTADASAQLEAAVRFICAQQGISRVSLIAHSWGSMPAAHFAGRCPELVDRLVLFGPIARRTGNAETPRLPAWRLVSLQEQWDRFVAELPAGETPVLLRRHFEEWGPLYLDSDPESRTHSPAAVKIPNGPTQDIADALNGRFPYDPGLVRCPIAIIRGEWDSLCTDDDARWLFGTLRAAVLRRDVKISRGTHLMHLESSRFALYREAEAFLLGGDLAPAGESRSPV